MISVSLGRWSASAGIFFVAYRYYWRGRYYWRSCQAQEPGETRAKLKTKKKPE